MLKDKKLESIVFIGGGSIMVMEMTGARIIAPYLGTSIYVWASIIGVVLGALSLGYYIGGKLSDRNPQFEKLTSVLFWGGVSIAAIQLIKDPILLASSLIGVKLGSIIAVLGIFAVPSVILGTISPYAIRLKIESVENSGKTAGNLYALSTIGSITGTFLSGFFLIPAFTNSQVILGLSFVVVLTSMLGNKKILKGLFLIIVLILVLFSNRIPSPYVHESDSVYNHIRIVDFKEPGSNIEQRGLFLGRSLHSVIDKNSDQLMAEYEKFYLLDNLFKPQIEKGLTIGGGAYIAPIDFKKRYPDAEMTVVEIDSKLTKLAKEYFTLTDDHDLNIIHQDGRIFLNNNEEKFDVIYGDAYASYYSIPFHLTTVEAFQKISDSLEDDGVVILNIISSLKGEKSLFLQAEYKTISKIFPQLYIFPANDRAEDELQNIIVIATKYKNRLSDQELRQNATPDQKNLLDKQYHQDIINSDKTKILTDNFAPVDYYISKFL